MSDFDPNLPIYIQINNSIKQAIVSGILKPGERLASVRERAEELAVNPNTVQRAYQELEREGISETRRGMGTYIVEHESLISSLKAEMAHDLLRKYIDGMQALGFSSGDITAELSGELAKPNGLSTGGKR